MLNGPLGSQCSPTISARAPDLVLALSCGILYIAWLFFSVKLNPTYATVPRRFLPAGVHCFHGPAFSRNVIIWQHYGSWARSHLLVGPERVMTFLSDVGRTLNGILASKWWVMNGIYLECEQLVRERQVIGRIWTCRNLSSQILFSFTHFSIRAIFERLKLDDHDNHFPFGPAHTFHD